MVLVPRERQADNTYKFDYYLSNVDPGTALSELVRVAKAAHRIEECFERAKGQAVLADRQVRNWKASYHHQTLSLLAAGFLNQETRPGKNPDPRADVTADGAVDRGGDPASPQREHLVIVLWPHHSLVATRRTSQAVSPSLT